MLGAFAVAPGGEYAYCPASLFLRLTSLMSRGRIGSHPFVIDQFPNTLLAISLSIYLSAGSIKRGSRCLRNRLIAMRTTLHLFGRQADETEPGRRKNRHELDRGVRESPRTDFGKRASCQGASGFKVVTLKNFCLYLAWFFSKEVVHAAQPIGSGLRRQLDRGRRLGVDLPHDSENRRHPDGRREPASLRLLRRLLPP